MITHYYKVAEHIFKINLPEDEKGIRLSSYEPFRLKTGKIDRQVLFSLTLDDTFRPLMKGEQIGAFDCGAADFGVFRLTDGTYQILISPPGGYHCGLLQTSPDFSTAIIATRGNDELRIFAINNALMLTYAFASANKNTMLVHASVIKYNNKGYLFLGKSGTGKSTHSDLWQQHIAGSELLNDDNPVVRIHEDGAVVYGSPWSGKTPCYKNDCAPIGAFIQIQQKPENHIKREKPLQAFATLLPSISTMKWDKHIYTHTCDSVGKLLKAIPFHTLGCRPDKEAAEVCHREVTQHDHR
jgi:hypothetical protein